MGGPAQIKRWLKDGKFYPHAFSVQEEESLQREKQLKKHKTLMKNSMLSFWCLII